MRSSSIINTSQSQREAHLKTALTCFESASEEALAGNLDACAILILKALAQERKAGSVGPQVLQLIKPRN